MLLIIGSFLPKTLKINEYMKVIMFRVDIVLLSVYIALIKSIKYNISDRPIEKI